MKLLVCGSRSWLRYQMVESVLNMFSRKDLTIMHGGAKGADSLVAFYCRRYGVAQEVYLPCWELYGNSAGLIRNEYMVECQPDRVVAFWDGASPGTRHTLKLARARHIPTEVWG